MKRIVLILSGLLTAVLPLHAAQLSRSGSTTGGVFAVTNQISNVQVIPVAVLLDYASPVAGTVRVERVSGGNTYLLSIRTLTNHQALVWTPDFPCAFTNGEALRVAFPAATGAVQLLFDRLP